MLIPLAPVFLVIIPLVILFLSKYIDRVLGIPRFILQPINLIVGIAMILIGLTFALWSIESQFKIGKGTPVPMMPTHKLVIVRPFLYCRNPMTFGTILMYLGVSVVIGSLASFGLVILMALALITYIKLVEEKELELRFGKEYLDYKKSTPFIIPRV
jgi:protein-S-isoprenylcysteine O-methyltransferase Ste14